MLTLDEAIKHCEEKAKELNLQSYTVDGMSDKEKFDCLECAREHEQLAGWLTDYKRLLEMPTGDLISREALKEEINKKRIVGRFNTIQIIDNAPTVIDHSVEIAQKSIELGRRVGRAEEAIKSQRPQGEWTFDEKGNFYCDQCGKYPHDQYATTDFCPNCGADMKGGAEE